MESYLDELAGEDSGELPVKGAKVIAGLQDQETAASLLKDVLRVAGQGASRGASDELIAGAKTGSFSSPEYIQERNILRQDMQRAKDRVPWSPVVEAIGQTAIPLPIMGGASLAKSIVDAGLSGIGEAPEMEDVPRSAATSMALQGAAEAAGTGLKKMIAPDSTKILTKSMGAKERDVLQGGGTNVVDAVERLKKTGFFKQGDVAVDGVSRKFNRVNNGLSSFLKPQNLDSLTERASIAISKLKDTNNSLIQGKKIKPSTLIQSLNDGISEMTYDPHGFNIQARSDLASEVKDIILEDLVGKGHLTPNNSIDASAIEGAKKSLDLHMGSPAFKKRAEDLGLNPEALSLFRKRLDDLVDSVGGLDYKKNNEMMSDLITLKNVIERKGARDYVDTGSQLVDARRWPEKLMETLSPTPVDIGRANLADFAETSVGQAAGKIIKNTPVQSLQNRRPQSTFDMTPAEVARTRLPRTTEGLLQNKDLVVAKLSVNGVPPEMIENVVQALNDDPESVGAIASLIAAQYPTLFEKSKYTMFDGKLLDPQERARAADETSKRDDLNSLKKAKIINELNKTGKWLGE